MERFLRLGLPTTRDESWRYTNLRRLAAQSFVDAPRAPPERSQPPTQLDSLGHGRARSRRCSWSNGYPMLPARMDLSINGIEINSLRDLSRIRSGAGGDASCSRCRTPTSARWALLNTALFVDGLYLKVSTAD